MERASVLTTCVVCVLIVGIQVSVWPLLRPLSRQQHHRWHLTGGGGGNRWRHQPPPSLQQQQQTREVDAGDSALLQLLRQAQEAVQGGSISSSLPSSNVSALLLQDDSMPPLGAVSGEAANGQHNHPAAAGSRMPQHHCQPAADALRLVAATAFTADVSPDKPGTADSPAQAHAAADALRRELAAKWVAALMPLQPVSSSKLKSAGGATWGAGCRSIHIPPLRALQQQQAAGAKTTSSSSSARRSSSTTLLLVLDRWERLEPQLQELALSLFMLWGYASVHGYDLHIYVHGRPLPPWMPVYFIKPPGILHMLADWRYEHVLYTDWDVLLSPHTAPPLSLFFGEFPAASLLQQGEYNLCAGVNLWRRSADAEALLRAWWAMGAAGCCPSAQHDQSALKHLVAASLANASGDASLYGPRQQRHFVLPPAPLTQHNWTRAVFTTESPPQRVTSYLRARPRLQTARSAVGLVALEANAPPARPLLQAHDAATAPRVALTSCLGIWWGCVPADTPALLYHVGHVYAVEWPSWLVPTLLAFMRDWVVAVSDLASSAAAAGAAPAP